ncbi:fungal specific transcription factor domain-containing protein [Ophiostoma piceae UAMH 11346]|uniref:Fungal specific transcription factor domain-containing protein n=1 Tax=Ophiostoma piceae (strain UAMH 11346) TaxID=1262450 RepID=S3CHS9_OPHP1|nr:fungal specific transcription factor domain-containing protein [Ophiostoma piceae UAMH 11346]
MDPFDSPSSSPGAPRPTRKQVSRACDWCRARRVKCNSERPCRACESKGIPCVTKGTDEPRSLPQALREIERLKDRVRELEAELEACHLSSAATAVQSTPASICIPPSDAQSNADANANANGPLRDTSLRCTPGAGPAKANAQWEGIFVATARSEQTSYYGPSSAFYFISRIGAYIGKTFQQSFQERTIQPHGMNQTLADPTSVVGHGPDTGAANTARVPSPSLSRAQEEYFLSTFWEGLHCNVPIVDEAAFKRHYNALWEQSGSRTLRERKDSALVDIVLALCIQSSSTFIPRGATPSAVQPGLQHDATLAGRWHYRRCQSLSLADMESPTIATVQCQIFSLLYLCCASFQNTAHMVLAQAIRQATVLGLHCEPPTSMPRSERELRKRIWWVLFTIEAKTCTKLGRPFAIHSSQVSVTLPSDDAAAASLSGSSLGVYGSGRVTYLSYALQCQRLSCAATQMYHTAWAEYGEILLAEGLTSPYKNPETLERCAHVLTAQMPALQAWVGEVPDDLKTARQRHGRPFSLDRSPLEIDTLAPTYLQRQRLYLEMLYHTLVTNLYRPFITFYHSPGAHYTPATERHAAACVNHGIAHILIMHQAVKETTLLAGWHEFFLLHWNATVTVLGFLLAHPIHPSTAHARDAIEKSIEVCDVYGAHFGVAASAASIARCLLVKADQVMSSVSSGIFADGPGLTEPETAGQGHAENWGMLSGEDNGDGLAWLQPGQPADSEQLDEFMDWALTVDSFNSLEQFFAPTSDLGF